MLNKLCTLVFPFVVGILFANCSNHNSVVAQSVHRPIPDPGSTTLEYTSHHTPVFCPQWLRNAPGPYLFPDNSTTGTLIQAVFAEIEQTQPEIDSHFPQPQGQVGPPPGWQIVVMPPGVFETTAAPLGVARGQVDFTSRTIWVSFRFSTYEKNEYLPALDHEYLHAWVYELTGDLDSAARAGHNGQAGTTCVCPGDF